LQNLKPLHDVFSFTSRILAIKGEGDEKSELMKEFKGMRCGNFNRDKTVCCDGKNKDNKTAIQARSQKNSP
jgi:hypothetical protein